MEKRINNPVRKTRDFSTDIFNRTRYYYEISDEVKCSSEIAENIFDYLLFGSLRSSLILLDGN